MDHIESMVLVIELVALDILNLVVIMKVSLALVLATPGASVPHLYGSSLRSARVAVL